jgi:hypothetical protein
MKCFVQLVTPLQWECFLAGCTSSMVEVRVVGVRWDSTCSQVVAMSVALSSSCCRHLLLTLRGIAVAPSFRCLQLKTLAVVLVARATPVHSAVSSSSVKSLLTGNLGSGRSSSCCCLLRAVNVPLTAERKAVKALKDSRQWADRTVLLVVSRRISTGLYRDWLIDRLS